MRVNRSQTKVVATVGPASSTKEVLTKMFHEGVDVIRVNFSHSSKEEYFNIRSLITELNTELQANVSLLADLQGPKLRVGEIINNHLELNPGEIITLVTYKCLGTKEGIYVSYRELPAEVHQGEYILVDDGKIKLEVVETNAIDWIKVKVISGGVLSSKKGINLPDTKMSLPCLTEEDISNANYALENDVDWLALSFVRSAADITALKSLVEARHSHAGIIAKIEKPEALEQIDEIIELSDGIMVARGDLGVEVSFDKVPLIQKEIVNKCILQSKPVIIATQMMESMITNFRPTRAEATDVANAVLDSADALMLSGETSVGSYPAETINAMQRIIDYTEFKGRPFNKQHEPKPGNNTFLADSICYNASLTAQQVNARAIITFTHSGYTAYRISSHRPAADIFAFTNEKKLIRKLSLVWGVRAFFLESFSSIDDAVNQSIKILKSRKLIDRGDTVIHVGSTPHEDHGRTNMMKVSMIE